MDGEMGFVPVPMQLRSRVEIDSQPLVAELLLGLSRVVVVRDHDPPIGDPIECGRGSGYDGDPPPGHLARLHFPGGAQPGRVDARGQRARSEPAGKGASLVSSVALLLRPDEPDRNVVHGDTR